MLVEDQIHKTKLPVKAVLERVKTKGTQRCGVRRESEYGQYTSKFSKSNKIEKLTEKILG